jgi:hypothetical protein
MGGQKMAVKEAIKTLKLMQAQVEWEYPMDYAVAIDEVVKALEAQEWIPCNPLELPKDKKLWVTHDRWGCRYVNEVYWDMTEWSDNVSDVVAYMPYTEPEPYKEDT